MADVETRAFVVGCPRSGTTLVQSLLNAHPSIRSFPETHAFEDVRADLPWRRWGLVRTGAADGIRSFLAEIGREDLADEVPRRAFTWGRLARALVRVLDALALEEGARAWVEKTPDHLDQAGRIAHHIPDARFVHVVRNGPDVVASLRAVTREHPEAWGRGQPWTLEECATKWMDAVRRSLDLVEGEAHELVRYEEVAADPEGVLEGLLDHLSIPWRAEALSDRREAARELVQEDEPWKADVGKAVENRNGRRFHRALDPGERDRVLELLESPDLEDFVEPPPPPDGDQHETASS